MILSLSILNAPIFNLKNTIVECNNKQKLEIHLDIMDGHFVPNLTFGAAIPKAIREISELYLDAHLMVNDPLKVAKYFPNHIIDNITVHLEALSNPLGDILKLKDEYSSVGLSIKPGTDVSLISDEMLGMLDRVLVMTVEPGFGGQKLIDSCLSKTSDIFKRIKELNTICMIQVDGGVNANTLNKIKNFPIDNVVIGSYIFKNPERNFSDQLQKTLEDLKSE